MWQKWKNRKKSKLKWETSVDVTKLRSEMKKIHNREIIFSQWNGYKQSLVISRNHFQVGKLPGKIPGGCYLPRDIKRKLQADEPETHSLSSGSLSILCTLSPIHHLFTISRQTSGVVATPPHPLFTFISPTFCILSLNDLFIFSRILQFWCNLHCILPCWLWF